MALEMTACLGGVPFHPANAVQEASTDVGIPLRAPPRQRTKYHDYRSWIAQSFVWIPRVPGSVV